MDYKKIYNQLVAKAQSRDSISEKTEIHHIVPRCMGGSDESENLVVLSLREHFIAHLLLSEMYGGKLTYAFYLMSKREGCTNRKYEHLREDFISAIKNDKERGKKISKSLTGVSKSEEHKENYRKSRANGVGWICPEHKKQAQKETMKGEGNPMWGRTHGENARKIISEVNKQQITCPHCGKVGGIAIMKRWHFDNCKNKAPLDQLVRSHACHA